MGSYVLQQMQPKNYITLAVFYAIAALYTVLRIKYLKDKKGIDMVTKMKEPYKPWLERERLAAEKSSPGTNR